jgi:hypothetical protein
MNYTRFNRHEDMNSETRSEILSLIREISCDDNIEKSLSSTIENSLYGLFDGYLYESLQIDAQYLPTNLAAKVIKIFNICSRYPKLETLNN